LDHRFLEEVVGALFPGTVNEEASREGEEQELLPPEEEEELPDIARNWSPESGVSEEELPEAIGRIGRIGAREAPGTDGVPARLWKDVAGVLAPKLRCLLNRFLARGEFSVLWKEERMVCCRSQDGLRTRFPPFGRCAFWMRLANCWREW
jgi:hypothetical protein